MHASFDRESNAGGAEWGGAQGEQEEGRRYACDKKRENAGMNLSSNHVSKLCRGSRGGARSDFCDLNH